MNSSNLVLCLAQLPCTLPSKLIIYCLMLATLMIPLIPIVVKLIAINIINIELPAVGIVIPNSYT